MARGLDGQLHLPVHLFMHEYACPPEFSKEYTRQSMHRDRAWVRVCVSFVCLLKETALEPELPWLAYLFARRTLVCIAGILTWHGILALPCQKKLVRGAEVVRVDLLVCKEAAAPKFQDPGWRFARV